MRTRCSCLCKQSNCSISWLIFFELYRSHRLACIFQCTLCSLMQILDYRKTLLQDSSNILQGLRIKHWHQHMHHNEMSMTTQFLILRHRRQVYTSRDTYFSLVLYQCRDSRRQHQIQVKLPARKQQGDSLWSDIIFCCVL